MRMLHTFGVLCTMPTGLQVGVAPVEAPPPWPNSPVLGVIAPNFLSGGVDRMLDTSPANGGRGERSTTPSIRGREGQTVPSTGKGQGDAVGALLSLLCFGSSADTVAASLVGQGGGVAGVITTPSTDNRPEQAATACR